MISKVTLVTIDDNTFNRFVVETDRRFTEDRQNIANLQAQVTLILTDKITSAIDKALIPINQKVNAIDTTVNDIQKKQGEETKLKLNTIVGWIASFALGLGSFIVFKYVEILIK